MAGHPLRILGSESPRGQALHVHSGYIATQEQEQEGWPTMSPDTTQALKVQAQGATQALTTARATITDAFAQDYVVGSSAMEALISAQHSVHYWAQVTRIVARAESVAGVAEALSEWVTHTTDKLLESGRSSSTSLVRNAITLSEEDELKRVLHHIRGYVSYIGRHS